MLVLTRKQGETIQVGDDVMIKVIKTGKGTVKIGIEAPNHVKVLRGELELKMDTETVPYATSGSDALDVQMVGYFSLPQSA